MRRALTAVLVAALAAAPAAVASLHVHDYAEHDHPEHHHGPAMHQHGHRAHVASDSSDHDHADRPTRPIARLDSCEPGGHAVAVRMIGAPAPHGAVTLAAVATPVYALPPIVVRGSLTLTDVRVHGPPFDARIAARAPPLTIPA